MPVTSEIFKKYRKDITTFVETGTLSGTGVQAALDSDFEFAYSMEAYEARFNKCVKRFRDNKNVSIMLGDSSKDLHLLLDAIEERSLFWLDAHFAVTGREKQYEKPLYDACPVIAELKQIQEHPIKNHTILIDDRRAFDGKHPRWHNISEEQIFAEIYKINLQYKISTIDSSHFTNDIIVAEIL